MPNQSTVKPPGHSPRLREQWVEVSVFLFLIVPSMVISLFAVRQQGSLGFVLVAVATILRDLALVSLILFFLWHNAEPVARIGWKLKNGWKELVWGIVLFPFFILGAFLVELGVEKAGLTSPSTPLPSFLTAKGPLEFVLAVILVLVVALAEETIFRGYLILRFEALTKSSFAAMLLSSAVFTVGHGYEGSAGLATVGVMGIALAAVYLWRRSLIAPIVMHFLQDFTVIVLLPLLEKK